MSQPISSSAAPLAVSNTDIASNTAVVADEQLDAQEIYSAEKQAEKYHENLAELTAEANSAPVKDKLSRLALIVAQKNLII